MQLSHFFTATKTCPTNHNCFAFSLVKQELKSLFLTLSTLYFFLDLMLPGVVFPENDEFPTFAKGDTVAVATEDTMVHVAVGISLMSSEEMLMSEGMAVCFYFTETISELHKSFLTFKIKIFYERAEIVYKTRWQFHKRFYFICLDPKLNCDFSFDLLS